MMENSIRINGARENNLKNISVDIPHGKHTVICGPSGSGKSTLAYDIIYATGQKRMLDCLSEETKVFTKQMKQPDIDYIKGLTPVISLKQHEPRKNPRATISTLTDANAYLKYMFSLMGQASCPLCKSAYPVHSFHDLVSALENLPVGTSIEIQFPVFKRHNLSYDDFFSSIRKKGYKKIELDDVGKDLRDWIEVDQPPQLMMVIADSFFMEGSLSKSSLEALKNALYEGDGFLRIKTSHETELKIGCPHHGFVTAEITPLFFSFSDIKSVCEDCHGSGSQKKVYSRTLIQNEMKSLSQGPFYKDVYNCKQTVNYLTLYSMAEHFGFSMATPFHALPEDIKNLILHGSGQVTFPFLKPAGYEKEIPKYVLGMGENIGFEGIVPWLTRYFKNKEKTEITETEQAFFNRFLVDEVCEHCLGTRLKPNRQWIKVGGKTYSEMEKMAIDDLAVFLSNLKAPIEKSKAFQPISDEICSKLNALSKIGLGYLRLDRRVDTLSGGEHQRVRLAKQLGSDAMMGMTYIIDEPTVGLHGADNIKVVHLLNELCEQGNTIITIEHDFDLIKSADHIIEVGPGAGRNGGEIVAQGSFEEVMANENSINAPFFLEKKKVLRFKPSNGTAHKSVEIRGARANNLKNIDVKIPLNQLVCFTGVSGSGKSSLVIDILYKAIWSVKHDAKVVPGEHAEIKGLELIQDVYCVDQSSIGKSSKSTTATYIGIMDRIRDLFATSEDALRFGLDDKSFFSFNAKGGCSSCRGKGFNDTHIHYLGNIKTLCTACHGERYKSGVLEVYYRGKHIKKVLDMSFDDAYNFFKDMPYIASKVKYVCDLGLGYMTLGQSVDTISGGEAKRLCLAKEMSKIKGKKHMLYILDEPTSGLHPKDVLKLMVVVRSIVERGHSVIVIEHNPDVILQADCIIDMGPEGGEHGGQVVKKGELADIMACKDSKTGQYMSDYLKGEEVILRVF